MNKILFAAFLFLLGCGGAVDDGFFEGVEKGGMSSLEPTSAGAPNETAGAGGDVAVAVAGATSSGGEGGSVEVEQASAGTGGSAGAPDSGGAAGAGGQTVCEAKTYAEACPPQGPQNKSCGGMYDGCGGVIDCGGCSDLNLCDHVHNTCLTCTPTTSAVAQNYCKENEPEHPKAYQDCAFTFHDCVRVDSTYWCCSF